MRRLSTSKTIKNASKPLKGVVCYVETLNEDGTDATQNTIKVLQGLGATVDPVFKMGLTHMIWSNGNMKHVKAAEYMDIVVVSPLWVENCRESGTRVPESDFAVNPTNLGAGATSMRKFEPQIESAKTLPEPDSPSLSSSQIIAQRPLRVLDGNIATTTAKTSVKGKAVSKSSNKSECFFACSVDSVLLVLLHMQIIVWSHTHITLTILFVLYVGAAPVPDEENTVPSRAATSVVSSRDLQEQRRRTSSPEVSTRHSPRLPSSTSPGKCPSSKSGECSLATSLLVMRYGEGVCVVLFVETIQPYTSLCCSNLS